MILVVAAVSLTGATLTVSGVVAGSANVTVTATDVAGAKLPPNVPQPMPGASTAALCCP